MNGAAKSPSTAVAASPSPRLSHKSNAAAHSSASHKSAGENPSSSSPSSASRLPHKPASPSSHKSRERRPHGDRPLVSSSPRANGHDDSEAETEILSEDGPVAPRPRKPKTDDRHRRPRKSDLSDPSLSLPNSRRSSMTGYSPDQKTSRHNGAEPSDASRAKSSASKSGIAKSRPSKYPLSDSSRAQSVEPSVHLPSSGSRKGDPDIRKSVSAEPRKRKLSDEHSKSKVEPAKRPRLDTKPSSAAGKTSQSSPSSPALPHSATHARSTSGQSNPIKPPARKTREFSASSLEGRDKREDFSDGGSPPQRKPRPPVPALQPPRGSKAPPLVSPARSVAHVRRADKYGTTPLAKACEKGALDAVRRAYEQCPEELDQADHGGFTPLQKASLQGHVPVVKFLLDQNCRIDCCSKEERDTPLIDAVENGHLEVVRLLLNKNVNPHASNIRGNRAIDSIDTSMPNHKEIRAALEEAMARHQVVQEEKEVPGGQPESKVHRARREKGLRPDLLYSELSKDNLLRYSTSGDLEAVGMMLESVKPDNSCVVAAARGGHDVVLNLLLASASEVLEKDPDPAKYRETPMTVAIGRGHLKVIQLLLDQDNFNPCRTTKDGKTYYQLAEERHGPYWQTEYDMLKKRYDEYKAAQKARMLQKQAKAKSSGKLQAKQKESDAPKSPVLMKTKTKAPKPEDESKQKRLLISRESQNKDASKSRRVVDDDTSAASADDAASQPSKPAQRPRTNSSGTKPLRVKAKSDRSPPSSPLLTESKNRTGRKLKDRNHIKSEDMEPSDIDVDKQSTKRRMSSGTQRTSKADTDAKESREVRESREKRIAKRARLEAGAKAKDDAEAREKARAKEAEVRAKEAEEAREQAKVEAEARARQAEIKAREEARRLKRIREEEEREREEREQRLASLPLAIRNAMEKGRDRPLFATDDGRHGIADQFLPIYVYRHKDIVLDDSRGQTPPAPFSEDLWMMSFAAVGILGLPELHLDEFPSWPKLHVTDAQRRDFLRAYDISNLAQAHAWPQGGTEGYDHAWTQARLREAESQFLAMQPLWWVRLDDCARAVAARRDLAPLRLRTFELARPAAAPIDDFWSTFPGSGKATPAITPKRDPGTPVVERAVEALTNGDSAMHVDEA